MVTKEQFAEWKTHPVTIEVYAEIKDLIAHLKDQLASGVTLKAQAETTQGLTSRLVGQIDGLNQLLNLKYEDD